MPFPRLGYSLSIQPYAPANAMLTPLPLQSLCRLLSKQVNKVKDFKCPFCEWCGATMGVVKTHIKKKHI